MEDNSWLIYNGMLKQARQPLVSIRSRGLMYGDGCFETFRTYSGRCFALEKHLKRLEEGMQFLGIAFPDELRSSSFRELLYKMLEKNKLLNKDAVIRVQVWREGERGYRTEPQSPAHFSMLAGAYTPNEPVTPITLAMVDIRRIPDRALPSRFKLSNGIGYIVAARQAQAKGADDALMLTLDDYVSETTIANIFWVKEHVVYTPSKACDLLPGITREVLIENLRDFMNLRVEEGTYSPEEVLDSEFVWICNSVRELVPVVRINDQPYPSRHPVFKEIKRAFATYRDQKLSPLR